MSRDSNKSRGSGLVLLLLVCAAAANLCCGAGLLGTAVIAGGAGAVGYEVVKDDRTLGTKVDDAAITTAVKTKLIGDDRVRAININVDTFEGVVTLHGHVPSVRVRDRAVALARSVKGVKSVQSKLSIVPD